jgi:hypothetical protein
MPCGTHEEEELNACEILHGTKPPLHSDHTVKLEFVVALTQSYQVCISFQDVLFLKHSCYAEKVKVELFIDLNIFLISFDFLAIVTYLRYQNVHLKIWID